MVEFFCRFCLGGVRGMVYVLHSLARIIYIVMYMYIHRHVHVHVTYKRGSEI